MTDLVLLTPTYGRDRERFALLRESLRHFGVVVPHVAVVDDDDDPRSFVDPTDADVEVIRVGDFLPPELARRATRPYRRRDPRFWAGGHWRDEPRVHGWKIQQLVKLFSVRRLAGVGTVACVDSDLFLLGPLTDDAFRVADGRSRLFESADTEAEMLGWELQAMDYLDVERREHQLARHTFEPAVIDGVVGRQLLDVLAARGGGRWWRPLVHRRLQLTEYALYGTYARFIAGADAVVPSAPLEVVEARYGFDPQRFAQLLSARQETTIWGMVRSALGAPVEAYERAVRSAWGQG